MSSPLRLFLTTYGIFVVPGFGNISDSQPGGLSPNLLFVFPGFRTQSRVGGGSIGKAEYKFPKPLFPPAGEIEKVVMAPILRGFGRS